MTHIDHQIARFLEALSEFKLDDHTWICFVSDHGEMLGDHHLWRKSTPYEGSARIPLILRAPNDAHLPRGAVRDGLAELRDVMPTLLDCAGLPAPESIEGESLLPHARGLAPGREILHGECILLGQSLQWLTDGREKYVWFSENGREQLFNLIDDPQEKVDLVRERSQATEARLRKWRSRLSGELVGREEGFINPDGELVVGRPVAPVLQQPGPGG